jgi:hypothetical protein
MPINGHCGHTAAIPPTRAGELTSEARATSVSGISNVSHRCSAGRVVSTEEEH